MIFSPTSDGVAGRLQVIILCADAVVPALEPAGDVARGLPVQDGVIEVGLEPVLEGHLSSIRHVSLGLNADHPFAKQGSLGAAVKNAVVQSLLSFN
ncbi:hypothetical protein BH93_02485 [Rhodococcoides fascians A25f]|uniref:hypothetical protein n=1 Tax=Rhodococcoides fascians TaxID=1828 RepID=UPI00055DE595|nr:hypothetical protein [Rhodococcus fascians]QII04382.1 hypothetical protein BH93_02485 [Rhodococcus fascians A25f]